MSGTKCYKLTNQNHQTQNNIRWGENITHKVAGSGKELCTDGYIHAYTDPLLAVFLNPIHADIENPVLWEATGHGRVKNDKGLKIGFKSLTTVSLIPLPEVSTEQRVRFAIYCALEVHKDDKFRAWAEKWLSGEDKSAAAARAAAYAAARANPLDLKVAAHKAME